MSTNDQNLTITLKGVPTDVSSVRITGPWWSWDPNGGPVATDNGDETWTVTMDRPTEDMQYLWVVDDVQENLIQHSNDSNFINGTNFNTDNYSYANRMWILNAEDDNSVQNNLSDDYYPSLKFTLNGVPTEVTSVRMTGPMWNWDPNAGPEAIFDNGEQVWKVTVTISPHTPHEYLWIIDGVQENLIPHAQFPNNFTYITNIDDAQHYGIDLLHTNYHDYANRLFVVPENNAHVEDYSVYDPYYPPILVLKVTVEGSPSEVRMARRLENNEWDLNSGPVADYINESEVWIVSMLPPPTEDMEYKWVIDGQLEETARSWSLNDSMVINDSNVILPNSDNNNDNQNTLVLKLTIPEDMSGVQSVRMTGPWWSWDPNGGPVAIKDDNDNDVETWTVTMDSIPTEDMEYFWVVTLDDVNEPTKVYGADFMWEVNHENLNVENDFSPQVSLLLSVEGSPPEVRMTGPWWNWDPNGGPIARNIGNNKWLVKMNPPTEDMEYKWVIDGQLEETARLWSLNDSMVINDSNVILPNSDNNNDNQNTLVLKLTIPEDMSGVQSVRMTGPWWSWDPNGGPVAIKDDNDNDVETWTVTMDSIPTEDMEYFWVVTLDDVNEPTKVYGADFIWEVNHENLNVENDFSPQVSLLLSVEGSPPEVRMTGPWWNWDPNGGPIARNIGNNKWLVKMNPPTEDMEYKWVIDGQLEETARLWSLNDSMVINDSNVILPNSDNNNDNQNTLVLKLTIPEDMSGVQSVRMTGPWWSWDPNGGPEANDNGDGTWTVTMDSIPTEEMEYFWVVTLGDVNDPTKVYGADFIWEVNHENLNVENDFSPQVSLLLSVEGSPSEVHMTGPWWNWGPNGGPIARNIGNNKWLVKMNPPTEDMEYKWVIDGQLEETARLWSLNDSMVINDSNVILPNGDSGNNDNNSYNISIVDSLINFKGFEWKYETTADDAPWPHNFEKQSYDTNHAEVIDDNGNNVLKISLTKHDDPNPDNPKFKSSRLITTDNNENLKVSAGHNLTVEFEVKFDETSSSSPVWPALWMLGAGIYRDGAEENPWPKCGEIDVMEWSPTHSEQNDFTTNAIHFSSGPNGSGGHHFQSSEFSNSNPNDPPNEYHRYKTIIYNYGEDSDENKIEMYYNDALAKSYEITNNNYDDFFKSKDGTSDKYYGLIMNIAYAGHYTNKHTDDAYKSSELSMQNQNEFSMYIKNITAFTAQNPDTPNPNSNSNLNFDIDMFGFFDGMALTQDNAYIFPASAQDWAGVANLNNNVYPFTFSDAGEITFTARSDSPVSIYFKFENEPYPGNTESYQTENVEVSGNGDQQYTVVIPSQVDISTQRIKEFRSFLMYIVERNISVTITNIKVKSDMGITGDENTMFKNNIKKIDSSISIDAINKAEEDIIQNIQDDQNIVLSDSTSNDLANEFEKVEGNNSDLRALKKYVAKLLLNTLDGQNKKLKLPKKALGLDKLVFSSSMNSNITAEQRMNVDDNSIVTDNIILKKQETPST